MQQIDRLRGDRGEVCVPNGNWRGAIGSQQHALGHGVQVPVDMPRFDKCAGADGVNHAAWPEIRGERHLGDRLAPGVVVQRRVGGLPVCGIA